MNAALTELVFILDRSGSMNGLEEDTIGGFNGMIKKQKAEGEKVNVTTVLFDDEVEKISFIEAMAISILSFLIIITSISLLFFVGYIISRKFI